MFQTTILKSLLSKPDGQAFESIRGREEHVFKDVQYLDLYKMIYKYYMRYDRVPNFTILNEQIKLDKLDLIKELKEVQQVELTEDEEIQYLIDNQIAINIKNATVALTKNYGRKIKLDGKSTITEHIENMQEVLVEYKSVLEKGEHKQGLLYGDTAQQEFIKYYSGLKQQEGYYVSKFGIKNIDDITGGKNNVDFISVGGFVGQAKSTLLRYMAWQDVKQGKNVAFVSLEMGYESMLTNFYTLHANDISRFGFNIPKVTTKSIREGSLSDEEETHLFEEVIPDFTGADDLGSLYIIQPEGMYTVDEMFAEIRRVHKNVMPIDVLYIDYATLLLPHANSFRADPAQINQMLRRIRNFGLTFDRGRGLCIVNAVQINRGGYESMLKDAKNEYNLSAMADYNAIEKDSTMIITVAITPEMRASKEVQIQHLKSRESNLFPTFKMTTQLETGQLFTTQTALSDEESAEILDEIEL